MKKSVPPEQEASPQGASPESEGTPSPSTKQGTRRRLLGAALGVPLIYTLQSGAKVAAGSADCADPNANTSCGTSIGATLKGSSTNIA